VPRPRPERISSPFSIVGLVLFLSLSPGGARDCHARQKLFLSAYDFLHTDGEPGFITLSDLDGDGFDDAVMADETNGRLIIARGGKSQFDVPVVVPVPLGPMAVSAADMDEDGDPDLVTANDGQYSVTVLLNDGLGNLVDHYDLIGVTANYPKGVVTGDLNSDGRPDIVVSDAYYGLSVLLMGRAGRIGELRKVRLEASGYGSVLCRDVDDDGNLDILLGGNVSLLLGDGSGGFGAPIRLAHERDSWTTAIGDLNGDGRRDIVVVNWLESTLSISIQNADHSFQFRGHVRTGFKPSGIALADLNRDGLDDIVVGSTHMSRVAVHLAMPGGEIGPPTYSESARSPRALVATDLSGDGVPDIAAVCQEGMALLTARGDGTFGYRRDMVADDQVTGIAVADVDGDGRTDCVSTGINQGVAVWRASPSLEFERTTPFLAQFATLSPVTADFDRDGRTDIAFLHRGSHVRVCPALPAGGWDIGSAYPIGGRPSRAITGDWNRDGAPDLATTDEYTNTVSVLLNIGNGSFGPTVSLPVDKRPRSLVSGDFDGDGQLDLVTANFITEFNEQNPVSSISFLKGLESGSFTAAVNIPAGRMPRDLATADFDGDGNLDIVLVGWHNGVTLLRGTGDGGFRTYHQDPDGMAYESVAIGDLNGDGRPEIAAGSFEAGGVIVVLLDDHGLPSERMSFGFGEWPGALKIADLDGDGRNDIACSFHESNRVGFLLSTDAGAAAMAAPSLGIKPPRPDLVAVTPDPASGGIRFSTAGPVAFPVRASLYDVMGRRVTGTTRDAQGPQPFDWSWDGRLDSGSPARRGVYFLQLQTRESTMTRKFVKAN